MKSVLGLIAISTLLLFSSCKPGPTTIVGSVSFLNPKNKYQPFPPTGHSGDLSDDVAYVRLLDDDGNGAVIWESAAIPSGDAISPFSGTYTPDEGVYIGTFVITLSDSQVAGLTVPLRLEAFLYDSPAETPLVPLTDVDRYSNYDANWGGDPGWFYPFYIRVNEVIHSSLTVTLPIE